jgi:hypothetical protein
MNNEENLEELKAVKDEYNPRKGLSERDIEIEERGLRDFLTSASRKKNSLNYLFWKKSLIT